MLIDHPKYMTTIFFFSIKPQLSDHSLFASLASFVFLCLKINRRITLLDGCA